MSPKGALGQHFVLRKKQDRHADGQTMDRQTRTITNPLKHLDLLISILVAKKKKILKLLSSYYNEINQQWKIKAKPAFFAQVCESEF